MVYNRSPIIPLERINDRRYKNLLYIAAPEFVVTAGGYDAAYKILHIRLAKDGSIYVSFPYGPPTYGILSRVNFPPNSTGPVTLDLVEGGKITSHLTKFSDHPDGRAHFALDGKHTSEVRHQSFRLDDGIGQVFQLHVYEPCTFERFDRLSREKNREYLQNIFKPAMPSALTVFGEWRRKEDVVNSIRPVGRDAGPVTKVQHRVTGAENTVFFIGQPEGHSQQRHVIQISVAPTSLPAENTGPGMIFLGGFDPHEVSTLGEVSHVRNGLAFMYPIESAHEWAARIGSVDWTQTDRAKQG